MFFFDNFVLTSLFGLVVDVVISNLVGSGGFKNVSYCNWFLAPC